MKTKTLEFGPVTYSFAGKWHFKVGTFTLLTVCPGGRETANKVAKALAASFKRTKSESDPLDGLGQWTIRKLVAPARTLRRYANI